MSNWEYRGEPCTVRKEIKCCTDSEILHGIVHYTTRKSEKHNLIRVVSWTNLCSISESPLHFISFLTVWWERWEGLQDQTFSEFYFNHSCQATQASFVYEEMSMLCCGSGPDPNWIRIQHFCGSRYVFIIVFFYYFCKLFEGTMVLKKLFLKGKRNRENPNWA